MTGMVPDSLERRGKIKSSKTNLSISTDINPTLPEITLSIPYYA
ncbi:hypothetical protein ACWTCY_09585 [Anaerostipes caccae]